MLDGVKIMTKIGVIDSVEIGVMHLDTARILAEAPTSTVAIRALYEHFKAQNPKFSLAVICRRSGIASRGNLSDVLTGKRYLHLRYLPGIVRAFGLAGEAAECLQLLIARDQEKDLAERQRMDRRIATLRKTLLIQRRAIPKNLAAIFFGIEVFCAFGLFKNVATREQLARYFSSDPRIRLEEALAILVEMNMIAQEGDVFRVTASHVVFDEDTIGVSHIDFLKLALTNASDHVESWFQQKTLAYFESSVLSVKKNVFKVALKNLKSEMLIKQAELESGDADMLVRFNVQVYPIGGHPGASG